MNKPSFDFMKKIGFQFALSISLLVVLVIMIYLYAPLNSASKIVLVIAIGIITSFFMTISIIKPIAHLIYATQELSKGNLKHKVESSCYNEINILIEAFNQMSDKLKNLYGFLEEKLNDRTKEVEQKNKELEKANDDLKNAQSMMVHSEKMRSLGTLVAGITHEINNPINFIYGNMTHLKNYTEGLLNLIKEYEAVENTLTQADREKIKELKEYIELEFIKEDLPILIKSCKEGTERTKNIIIDLKNFSRAEEMVVNKIDVHKEIETTLNILHNKYKHKIKLHKEFSNIPKLESYGGQLNQVFMNILDNCAYAIKDKGDVYIRTKSDDKFVTIEFEDNGIGIKKADLEKIFDPFFTTKPTGEGTGLGMSISYKVIQNHHGTIDIQSEVNKGTKITINLPIDGLKNVSQDLENEKI